jgi:hypothetical protein
MKNKANIAKYEEFSAKVIDNNEVSIELIEMMKSRLTTLKEQTDCEKFLNKLKKWEKNN